MGRGSSKLFDLPDNLYMCFYKMRKTEGLGTMFQIVTVVNYMVFGPMSRLFRTSEIKPHFGLNRL